MTSGVADADMTDPSEVVPDAPMAQSMVWLLAASCAFSVANVYYAQPLLPDIARAFGLTVTKAGAVAMVTQLGVAAGMFAIVPMGDIRERRSLIVFMLICSAVCLAFVASAQNFVWLCVASAAMGLTGATVHVIIPLAAHLAPARQRGRVVGTVLGGLLIGILLSRTLSGFIGARLGWRAIYWIASCGMLVLATVLRIRLPLSRPSLSLRWPALIRSVLSLAREHHQLRESAFLGAMWFCAFSAFWTTLAFLLAGAPFHYGSTVAGAFGLVGAGGAIGAPVVGHLSDRRGPRLTILVALLTTIAAFVCLLFSRHSLIGLIVGVFVMDLGVQSGHVANQTRIYAIAPEARSRLNTFYMVSYFLGGALGSYVGAACWRAVGWPGVCGFALAVLLLGLCVFARGSLKPVS